VVGEVTEQGTLPAAGGDAEMISTELKLPVRPGQGSAGGPTPEQRQHLQVQLDWSRIRTQTVADSCLFGAVWRRTAVCT
jgi:hypothetical protein